MLYRPLVRLGYNRLVQTLVIMVLWLESFQYFQNNSSTHNVNNVPTTYNSNWLTN